jgi:WD40 repeat protein
VAVTSGLATTVLDTRTRAVVARIVLPSTDFPREDGGVFPAEVVWCAGWTPDGRLLLGAAGHSFAGDGSAVVVVDPSTWRVTRRMDIGAAPQVMETSPRGDVIAVADAAQSQLLVLDAGTLEVRQTLPLQDGDLAYDLSFSPDGRRLAAGGEQGLLYVWDTTTWTQVRRPADVHRDRLLQVEWTPDGSTVLTSGLDGAVGLYDVARGLPRARPLPVSGAGPTYLVPGVADEVIALGGDRPGRRYPLQPAGWLARACTIVGRDLTAQEWATYLPGRPYRRTCTDLSERQAADRSR